MQGRARVRLGWYVVGHQTKTDPREPHEGSGNTSPRYMTIQCLTAWTESGLRAQKDLAFGKVFLCAQKPPPAHIESWYAIRILGRLVVFLNYGEYQQLYGFGLCAKE